MKPPTPVELRMAHAFAWDDLACQLKLPKNAFGSEDVEYQQFAISRSRDLLDAMRRAGLVVSVNEKKK